MTLRVDIHCGWRSPLFAIATRMIVNVPLTGPPIKSTIVPCESTSTMTDDLRCLLLQLEMTVNIPLTGPPIKSMVVPCNSTSTVADDLHCLLLQLE